MRRKIIRLPSGVRDRLMLPMIIREDDPRASGATQLLREHLEEMAVYSPPDSGHALDVEGLCIPEITFFTAWEGDELVGCCALLELDSQQAEIKSMRTAKAHRRKGVASELVAYLVDEARRRGYTRLSLETGAAEGFAPARALYRAFEFHGCEAFGSYQSDRNSVFMSRDL